MKRVFKYCGLFLLTCCGVFGIAYFWGALMKPELEREPIHYSPEYIEATEELRDISFGEEDVYKVQHDVDYSEGESGSWYPKGESPILAELVEEGKLPPVAERVGPEPVVIQGRDGLGNYGGTWNMITNTIFTVNRIDDYMTGTSLVRWSPLGDPIVPHIAKRWEVSPDKREWIFYLREGMKWSDGHPFTADDILFWWNDEVKQKLTRFPNSMKVKGESGEILKIDPYTVKIIFSHPHGLFLERLPFEDSFYSPRHYMEKYHPELGNEELIDATMKAKKIPTRKALYVSLRLNNNPDYPRIWPWIYRTYKSNPPQAYVRNPYYWAVDTEGNQLPYVDRFIIDVKSSKLVPIAAASGAITMQAVNIYFLHYTLFMSQREAGGYDVYHWYPSGFRMWGILPNLNKNINPHDPMSKPKRELLKDKRFRQALSLAINREQIIDAVYYGVGVPTQGSPGVESPFYHEELKNSFIEYNPNRANELLDEAFSALTLEEQTAIYSKIQDIAVDNLWNINITTGQPWVAIVKKGFKSVPRNALYGGAYESIASGGLEAYYFEEPDDSPGVIAQIKREMTEITPPSHTLDAVTFETKGNDSFGRVVLHIILGIIAVGLILMGFKHPYIGRRLIIMVPTLLLISIISFTIIQLPPSNYIDLKILQAEYTGDDQAKIEAEQLREIYPTDVSTFRQYVNWLGLPWFLSFKSVERGLLQGHLGFSMESRTSVNEVVGDRILLTFLISLGSILFTWAIALPIGVYSAVRQYSIGDYFFTFLGFIGMCVPSFLLALLLMYWSNLYFGISMTGLYSPEYAGRPEWSWGKAADLMQHIWLPVVVLGVTGTASMIRVMRGNLLDELKKPYVVTAMAKGVRPIHVLLKYPVRIALNPFISAIGTLFPQLISGGAIVAMVLSLPTVGPLMLDALMNQDMYLAGSMLMVLSLVGVLGTLVSDLLLMWLDPRIRTEGGAR